MKTKQRSTVGMICVMGSAVIFGFTPVLAALSYQGGNNGVNMAFLRAFLPIPVLCFLSRGTPLPTVQQRRRMLVLGMLLFGCTLLLYSSYAYIPVGLATTLHFLYPLYVALYKTVIWRQPLGRRRIAGLLLGVAGAVLFLDMSAGTVDPRGFLLALASGICYAGYIIALGREARDPMPLYRLMLGISVVGVILCGGIGLATGNLTADLNGWAWVCAVGATLLVAVVGCVLFQAGVRSIGEADAAIFSLLEPITSILFGVLLLGDRLSAVKLTGCCLILIGLFIAGRAEKNEKMDAKVEKADS